MKKMIFFVSALFFCLGFCGVLLGAEEEGYYALFMDGKKVGYAVISREASDGKVKTVASTRITINRGKVSLSMRLVESTVETEKGEPLSFEAEQEMSFIKMKVSGRIEPNKMMTIVKGSVVERQMWPEGALMPEGLRLLEKEKGLKKGTTYTAQMFSPSSVDVFDTNTVVGDRQKVDLLGRVVELTEVRTKIFMPMAGEVESVGYVDDNMDVQKSVMPIMGMNVEMVACPKEFATSAPEVFDVFGKMFVKSPQPIENVRRAESITYYLSPVIRTDERSGTVVVDIIKLGTIPSTGNQVVSRAEGGKVIVKVKPAALPKGAKFPYKGKDKTIIEALKPSRFVQSDNEKIIRLARQAVGDTKDAAEAARRIEKFVADFVETRTLSVGYASAVEVAESREGDCSEFAVLTAALCRAVGIPARVVSGIAYVGQWEQFRDSFGGHAWVEAYIGSRWVGLDAAFKKAGRGGFDAGHIALAAGSGDPEDFYRLVNTFGQFKIDKIKVVTKK